MKKIKKLVLIVLLGIIICYGANYGMKMLYPIKYADYIEKYAEEFEVDPYLVISVIKTESNFDDKAMSQKGASGLMQITENTAVWIAHKLEIDDFNYDEDIKKPEMNIKMGVYYIAYLKEMYEGDTELSIAAYNAGFNNVDKWLRDDECSKDGKTLLNIPFPETKRYVNKVNNNYKIYKVLYKNEGLR